MDKQSTVNANRDLLAQKDYIGRKVAFEIAALFKQKYPNVQTPMYDKYKEVEAQADLLRAEMEG